MAKSVILTPCAEFDYTGIIEFLINNWNVNVCNDFVKRFKQVCSYISKNPEMYTYINGAERVQKCVVTRHNVMYFVVTEDRISIITIFDTRQNPEKLYTII